MCGVERQESIEAPHRDNSTSGNSPEFDVGRWVSWRVPRRRTSWELTLVLPPCTRSQRRLLCRRVVKRVRVVKEDTSLTRKVQFIRGAVCENFHSTGRRARRREARLVETQHGGGSRRDEARYQPEPRPDGGGAKPGGASSASRRPQPPPSNFTQPSNLIIRQHYRSQVDFKLSEPIEGACWKVKYTVDITEMKFVVEVRPRTTRPSPLEVSTDPAGVPSACFHSRVLRE